MQLRACPRHIISFETCYSFNRPRGLTRNVIRDGVGMNYEKYDAPHLFEGDNTDPEQMGEKEESNDGR